MKIVLFYFNWNNFSLSENNNSNLVTEKWHKINMLTSNYYTCEVIKI